MKVYLIGTGMGNVQSITNEALDVIKKSDVLIGSERIIESFKNNVNAIDFIEVNPFKIAKIIENLTEENSIISVLFSGDSGFYSGCKQLSQLIKGDISIIPGISTVSYFASKISRPWENVKLVSAHGKKINTNAHIISNKEVFFLTGGDITPHSIIESVVKNNITDCYFYVGENLSYKNERIISGFANQLINESFDKLAAVWCINKNFNPNPFAYDMEDSQFEKGNIPMTKKEVRSAVVKELGLKEDCVFYDIGGGTGSVSVAVSKFSPFIQIYTIERNRSAIDVIKKNFSLHKVINGNVIEGIAPDALKNLPAPDCVFIGGSGGNMSEIIDTVLSMNKKARIVITAVTLESLCKIQNILEEKRIQNWQGYQLIVNNIKKLGSMHGFSTENSVFIFSLGGEEKYEL